MPTNLRTIFQENKFYGIGFIIWLFLGAALIFGTEKGDVLLFFNDHRSYYGDLFFRYATMAGEEIAYVLILIFLLLYQPRAAWLVPITGGVVMLFSKGLKKIFRQNRPVAWFRELDLFETLNVIDGEPLFSGASSFPSGHTMSAFALFGLLALLIPQKKGVGLLILLIAIIVGISRVYLIHHFFMDIYAGSIIGTLLALVIYQLWNWKLSREKIRKNTV